MNEQNESSDEPRTDSAAESATADDEGVVKTNDPEMDSQKTVAAEFWDEDGDFDYEAHYFATMASETAVETMRRESLQAMPVLEITQHSVTPLFDKDLAVRKAEIAQSPASAGKIRQLLQRLRNRGTGQEDVRANPDDVRGNIQEHGRHFGHGI